MKKEKECFKRYVKKWIEKYRKRKNYSIEKMSEKLSETARSYYSQKIGKIGFSGWTICRLLVCMTDLEILEFVGGLRKEVWGEEFEEK